MTPKERLIERLREVERLQKLTKLDLDKKAGNTTIDNIAKFKEVLNYGNNNQRTYS